MGLIVHAIISVRLECMEIHNRKIVFRNVQVQQLFRHTKLTAIFLKGISVMLPVVLLLMPFQGAANAYLPVQLDFTLIQKT
jgi:hypothetical protein